MGGRKFKTGIFLACGVMIILGLALFGLGPRDPLAAQVSQILKQDMMPGKNNWQKGMDELWALGPGIIPSLAAQASQKDSVLSSTYQHIWNKLPPKIRKRLPEPVDRAELRQAAMHAIVEFGPLAVRRAAPQVIAGLSKTDDHLNNYSARGIYWLLPESRLALTNFERGLASTNGAQPSFESLAGSIDDIWAKMPELVPLLTNHLENAGNAYLAAIALGRAGSNAAPAVPALIQTVEMGAAGASNAEAAHYYVTEVFSNPLGWHPAKVRQNNKELNHNRAMAALALGRIGSATPEVCAALAKAWNNPDPWVSRNAALAIAMLGPAMTNDLPALLSGLREKDNSALDAKLQAIGKIGPAARPALQILRELTDTNRLQSLVTDPTMNIMGCNTADLALSAKIAICRIAPEEGRSFLPDITKGIGRLWPAVEFLKEPNQLSNDVVRIVEPLLDQLDGSRQSLAAYVILCHDREHAKALAVLRRNRAEGSLNDRLLAGRLLFESIGETNGLCSLIEEGFAPESLKGQSAAYLAYKMGDAALPAVPAFKKALWHKDRFVREGAGRLLIKLAPQEIPIKEDK